MKKLIKKLSIFLTWPLLIASILFLIETKYHKISGGDLNRIGKISINPNYRDFIENDEVDDVIHYSYLSEINQSNSNIDILVVGDSFSRLGYAGFVNYLSKQSNKTIVNANLKTLAPIQHLFNLVDGNFFENLDVEYVILQMVVRSWEDIINVDHQLRYDIDQLSDYFWLPYELRMQKYKNEVQEFSIKDFINRVLKYNLYSILYKYDDNAYFSKVYKFQLNKKLFSTKENELLVLDQEINNCKDINYDNIKRINEKLNYLSNKLYNKNIKLIFFPIPDKYDIYNSFIINNKYKSNDFFQMLRKEEKNYISIDTKKVLSPFLKDGMMDMYLADDTHWSFKSAKVMSKYILSKIYNVEKDILGNPDS